MICKEEICRAVEEKKIIASGSFKKVAEAVGCNKQPIVKGVMECYQCICCNGSKVSVKIACTPNKCVGYATEIDNVKTHVPIIASALLSISIEAAKSLVNVTKSAEGLSIDANSLIQGLAQLESTPNIEDVKEWLLECILKRSGGNR